MPGRTASRPSTTTRSPDCRPCSISQESPMRAPAFTGAGFDLVAIAHGEHRLDALILLHRALRHQDQRRCDARPRNGRGRTARGAARCCGLGNSACNSSVPVRGSTWLSEFVHLAALRKDGVIGQDQFVAADLPFARPCFFLHERQVLRFADFEANPDRVQRHDGGERLGCIRVDQAADRHQRVADQAADGRRGWCRTGRSAWRSRARRAALPPCPGWIAPGSRW